MQIKNKTNHKILADNVVVPKTLLDKSLGLLKYKTPVAMLLKTRFGIHTFGMKYPIDIVILDKQNRVVAMKENMKPNRIFMWNIKFETILELQSGTIQKTKTELFDQLSFSNGFVA